MVIYLTLYQLLIKEFLFVNLNVMTLTILNHERGEFTEGICSAFPFPFHHPMLWKTLIVRLRRTVGNNREPGTRYCRQKGE